LRPTALAAVHKERIVAQLERGVAVSSPAASTTTQRKERPKPP
jgi:hypothetical protein